MREDRWFGDTIWIRGRRVRFISFENVSGMRNGSISFRLKKALWFVAGDLVYPSRETGLFRYSHL